MARKFRNKGPNTMVHMGTKADRRKASLAFEADRCARSHPKFPEMCYGKNTAHGGKTAGSLS